MWQGVCGRWGRVGQANRRAGFGLGGVIGGQGPGEGPLVAKGA